MYKLVIRQINVSLSLGGKDQYTLPARKSHVAGWVKNMMIGFYVDPNQSSKEWYQWLLDNTQIKYRVFTDCKLVNNKKQIDLVSGKKYDVNVYQFSAGIVFESLNDLLLFQLACKGKYVQRSKKETLFPNEQI